jgi:hypothetical protein
MGQRNNYTFLRRPKHSRSNTKEYARQTPPGGQSSSSSTVASSSDDSPSNCSNIKNKRGKKGPSSALALSLMDSYMKELHDDDGSDSDNENNQDLGNRFTKSPSSLLSSFFRANQNHSSFDRTEPLKTSALSKNDALMQSFRESLYEEHAFSPKNAPQAFFHAANKGCAAVVDLPTIIPRDEHEAAMSCFPWDVHDFEIGSSDEENDLGQFDPNRMLKRASIGQYFRPTNLDEKNNPDSSRENAGLLQTSTSTASTTGRHVEEAFTSSTSWSSDDESVNSSDERAGLLSHCDLVDQTSRLFGRQLGFDLEGIDEENSRPRIKGESFDWNDNALSSIAGTVPAWIVKPQNISESEPTLDNPSDLSSITSGSKPLAKKSRCVGKVLKTVRCRVRNYRKSATTMVDAKNVSDQPPYFTFLTKAASTEAPTLVSDLSMSTTVSSNNEDALTNDNAAPTSEMLPRKLSTMSHETQLSTPPVPSVDLEADHPTDKNPDGKEEKAGDKKEEYKSIEVIAEVDDITGHSSPGGGMDNAPLEEENEMLGIVSDLNGRPHSSRRSTRRRAVIAKRLRRTGDRGTGRSPTNALKYHTILDSGGLETVKEMPSEDERSSHSTGAYSRVLTVLPSLLLSTPLPDIPGTAPLVPPSQLSLADLLSSQPKLGGEESCVVDEDDYYDSSEDSSQENDNDVSTLHTSVHDSSFTGSDSDTCTNQSSDSALVPPLELEIPSSSSNSI